MTITVNAFGETPTGELVEQIIIENKHGNRLGLVTWGAAWQSFTTQTGIELVQGYDNVADYVAHPYYLGMAIGRVGGRIGGATFTLGDQTYQLDANEKGNTLHGGRASFADRNWDYEIDEAQQAVTFKTTILSQEDHFPGDLVTSLTYQLTDDNEVNLTFSGQSNTATLYNPTSHVYVNPAGIDTNARELILQVAAPERLALDELQIPTGEKVATAGTAYDFMTGAKIDTQLRAQSAAFNANIDDAFVLAHEAGQPDVLLRDAVSGRAVEMTTDRDAVVIFTAHAQMDGHETDEAWFVEHPYNVVAIEAQHLPDAIHHATFSDIVLPANQQQIYHTTYAFKNI